MIEGRVGAGPAQEVLRCVSNFLKTHAYLTLCSAAIETMTEIATATATGIITVAENGR